MAKMIPLTRGKFALVDDADYEWLSQWKWHCLLQGYAARRRKVSEGGRELILMHRQITGAIDGFEVDHINGNKLDNRRRNLRNVTCCQNGWNRSKSNYNTSGQTGVSWHKSNKRWVAYIRANNKFIRLGNFKDFEDACRARKEAEAQYFGSYLRNPS